MTTLIACLARIIRYADQRVISLVFLSSDENETRKLRRVSVTFINSGQCWSLL